MAAKNGNIDMAKQLVEAGARVTSPMAKGVTVFHISAADGDVHLLDFAISRGQHLSLDLKTEDGWTPAQHAALLG